MSLLNFRPAGACDGFAGSMVPDFGSPPVRPPLEIEGGAIVTGIGHAGCVPHLKPASDWRMLPLAA